MDLLASSIPNTQLVGIGRLYVLRVVDADILLEVEGIEGRRAFLVELVATESHGDRRLTDTGYAFKIWLVDCDAIMRVNSGRECYTPHFDLHASETNSYLINDPWALTFTEHNHLEGVFNFLH